MRIKLSIEGGGQNGYDDKFVAKKIISNNLDEFVPMHICKHLKIKKVSWDPCYKKEI